MGVIITDGAIGTFRKDQKDAGNRGGGEWAAMYAFRQQTIAGGGLISEVGEKTKKNGKRGESNPRGGGGQNQGGGEGNFLEQPYIYL